MASRSALLNRPDPTEIIELPRGIAKISSQADTRVPNCMMFMMHLEDHTLGGILRTQLLRDPAVLFAGYRVPHPLEHKIELRVQTQESTTPTEAVVRAAGALIQEIQGLHNQLLEGLKSIKIEGQ
eukprot:Trichotokara_eunicae@DN5710_c0_g1_i3.p1